MKKIETKNIPSISDEPIKALQDRLSEIKRKNLSLPAEILNMIARYWISEDFFSLARKILIEMLNEEISLEELETLLENVNLNFSKEEKDNFIISSQNSESSLSEKEVLFSEKDENKLIACLLLEYIEDKREIIKILVKKIESESGVISKDLLAEIKEGPINIKLFEDVNEDSKVVDIMFKNIYYYGNLSVIKIGRNILNKEDIYEILKQEYGGEEKNDFYNLFSEFKISDIKNRFDFIDLLEEDN